MRSRLPATAGHILLAFLLSLTLAACTRDDTSAQGEGGSGDLLGTVQDLLKRAKKGGAAGTAAEDLEEVQTWIDKAKAATDKGKDDIATKNLKLAHSRLKNILEEQKKGAEAVKQLASDKTAAGDARKKADAEKAAQDAPEPYEQAAEALKKADELAAKGTWAAATAAKQLYVRAADHFEQAALLSKANKVARERAEAERKAMLVLKERAKGKGAEEQTASDWLQASQSERDAETQMQAGEFAQAAEIYRQATGQYQRALESVPSEAENEKAVKAPAKKTASEGDIDLSKLLLPREGNAEKLRTTVSEEKDSAAKETASKGDIDLSKLQLPREGYAERLRTAVSEEKDSAGVRATLSVVPNAYRYYMAVGFEELKKASYGKVELEKKLRELYAKHSKDKGKAIYFLSLSSKGGNDHHFTQTALKDHLLLRGKLKKTLGGFEEDQKPSFAAWQVFEQKSDQRNVLKKNLSEFKSLTFQFTSDQKAGDKEPLTLSVRGLVRVTDRREEQKTDYRAFEGINVGLKQISSSDWKSQTVPEIQFKLYPGQWQNPESPEGFDELLKTLEKNN